jgi:hypothetical protein
MHLEGQRPLLFFSLPVEYNYGILCVKNKSFPLSFVILIPGGFTPGNGTIIPYTETIKKCGSIQETHFFLKESI